MADRIDPGAQGALATEARASEVRIPGPVVRPPAPEGVEAYPLTPLQHGLLFQSLLAPGAGINVQQAVCRLREAVDGDRLEAAWARVVERHPILRTRFRWSDVPEPVQEVVPGARAPFARHDHAALAPAERDARLKRWLADDRARGIDLSEAPAMRLALFRRSATESVLVWTFHHAIMDGRSAATLLGEVFALHDGGEEGAAEPPARPPFRDHALWLHARDRAEDEAYWGGRLRGMDGVAPVRGGRATARDPEAEPRFDARAAHLSPAADGALRAFKAQWGVNLNVVAQAAWALLLGRLTASGEVVFGALRGGRATGVEGAEEMVGPLINTVPLRVRLPGEARVIDWLREMAADNAALRAHEHAAAGDIARWSGLAPGAPLFDTLFNYQTRSFEAAFSGRGGAWERRSFLMLRSPGYPLTVTVSGAAPLSARIEYDADLFDAPAVEAMLRAYCALLEALAAAPESPVSRLPLLRPEEREALLAAGRAARVFPVTERIHERFARVAAASPAAPALTFGGVTLTYGELDARAGRLARRLRARGVGHETRVGIYLERSDALVVALLAVLKAGGAYVPLDPAYPADRIAFVLDDASAPVVVTESALLPRLPTFAGATLLADADEEDDEEDAAPGDEAGFVAPGGPESLAYVLYTSGSTGRPKGVQVTHANVVRLFDATRHWFGFGADDVWTLFHSCAFDFSVWEIWGALLHGGRLVVVPFLTTRSPGDFHRLLVEEGVTVLNQTPSAFRPLAQTDAASGVEPSALRLRHVVFGGEALEPRALAPWIERHGDARPRLVNMYGITETTVHVTYRPVTRADLERPGSPIGVPIPDLALHLLDANLEPVPHGVPGELFVGGAGVARGYLNRPQLDAERFVRDPFSGDPSARLYRSGDLARRRAGGELEYLGRADQQVKVRGFRIETGEIEAALAADPAVAEAAVVARAEDGGEKRLVAYVVPRPGAAAPTPAALRARLAAALPEWMVPAAFVTLGALPLTANGKLDRAALPAPEEAGAAVAAEVYAAPRTPAEAALAEAWAETLGVERVGIDDNYFALGGDSIRGLRVAAAARRRGISVSIPELFRHQTVRELAAHLSPEAAGEVPSAAPFALLDAAARAGLPDDVEDAYPASRVQLAMLFHTQRDPASRVYLNLNGYRVHGRFDEGAMREALRRVAARHPALRTSFDLSATPEPLQRVHREAEIPLEVEDLRGLPPEARDAAFDRLKERGFDWTRAPLLRVHVQRLGDESFRLVVAEHHAVLDGWSVASLMTELLRLFAALRDGAPDPTGAPPATGFRDFVALEREAIASAATRAFWRGVMEGAPPSALPPREEGEAPAADAAPHLWVDVPAETAAGLRRAAGRAGVPLKTALLAAHLRVLAGLAGSGEAVTGYVTHGRPEAEDGARVLGLFLNTVPLRVDMRRGSWLELARRVHDAEGALLPHRRFPLAEIVREAGGRTPFEAAFSFNHFHVYDGLAGSAVRLEGDRFFQKTELPLVANVSVVPATGALRLRLEYDPARLAEAQASAAAGMYARAFAALAASPEAPWDEAPLLDGAEEAALLALSAGPAPEIEWLSVHRFFERQARATPGAPAVVHGGSRLSYAELNARANRLARHLARLGVGAETRVGVCLERGAEGIAAFLAVLKAGGAFVPLDPGYPAERLAFLLGDSGVAVLVTQESLRAALPVPPGVAVVSADGDREAIEAERAEDLAVDASPRSLAYVMYTSGSTGTPKGVGVEHRGIVRLVRGASYVDLGPDEAVLQAAPVSFDASTFEIWGALLNGGRLVVVPSATPSLEELERTIAENGVTTLWLTAGLFGALVEERIESLRGVRQLLAGGDVLPVEAVRRVRERFPALRLINGYGPTENTTFTCCHTLPATWSGGAVPIGAPISHTRAYLLDDRLRPVPAGVPGELYSGGEGVARGYFGHPAATAERFLPDPFSPVPGARMYRTGDRARRRSGGVVEYLGRLDAQVKVRGFRVEPGEVEAALGAHPAVERAAVAAHPDGAGGARLAAYVVARAGARPEAAELLRHLRERLPEPMVPASVTLLDALPLTPNGKVDRRALPAPGAGGGEGERYVALRTPTERAVAAVWAEVLGVDRVGAHDAFLALGGHSLQAIRAVARIRRETGCELALRVFLEGRTLAEVAAAVDAARADGASAAASESIPRRRRPAAAPPA